MILKKISPYDVLIILTNLIKIVGDIVLKIVIELTNLNARYFVKHIV